LKRCDNHPPKEKTLLKKPSHVAADRLEHFGEPLRSSKLGHRMTRETYAYPSRKQNQRFTREQLGERAWQNRAWKFRDEDHSEYSDAFLLVQRDIALSNFDLSMRYFDSLEASDFETALEHVLAKGRTFNPAGLFL
jgi:hypothetical protein